MTSEIDRYIVTPGQATGYKIGHNEINRLRDKAKLALGERYDLRDFDDALVLSGSVPLTLLERIIDDYVAASPQTTNRRTEREPSGAREGTSLAPIYEPRSRNSE